MRSAAKKLREKERFRQQMREGKPLAETGIRSHSQIAEIMTARGLPMSRSRVQQIERVAIIKLRAALADIACDFAPEGK